MSVVVNTYQEKENRLHPEISRWFVVYTKYKTEKFVADKLSKKGIASYIPLRKYTRRYSSKVKHYEVPLINCYVFVKIIESEYIKVLETEYVNGFLKNRGNLTDVKESEITILKKITGEITDLQSEEIQFIEGKDVEIISGNLTGIKGKLVEQHSKSEFLVELVSIGFQLRMNIDKAHLRFI